MDVIELRSEGRSLGDILSIGRRVDKIEVTL